MRVYIGTFGEGEAEVVAEDLRKAGIRTELKHSLNIEGEGSYSVQGKISELKEKYKEDRIAEEIKKNGGIYEEGKRSHGRRYG